jgi:murein L,D-transpeptidase YafK
LTLTGCKTKSQVAPAFCLCSAITNCPFKTAKLQTFAEPLRLKSPASGGDKQIPEGVYKIIALNPNSSYHLSLKISYPNEFDVLKATQDGRKNLGDNIFIHGSNRSIGCVAIGNNSIEELFVLIAKIGKENVSVIIAPNDIRKGNHQFQECNDCPKWINELYYQLDQQIKQFR